MAAVLHAFRLPYGQRFVNLALYYFDFPMRKFVIVLLASLIGVASVSSCTHLMQSNKPCRAQKVGNHR
jgi:hypothetical protein